MYKPMGRNAAAESWHSGFQQSCFLAKQPFFYYYLVEDSICMVHIFNERLNLLYKYL